MNISKSFVALLLLLFFGNTEEQDANTMEILQKALEREGEIQSYKSEININEQYSTKEKDQFFHMKFQQEFVEDVGLHQITEYSSGEITERYILKKELYMGDLDKSTNQINWSEPELFETEESYLYYMSQLYIYWDLKDLLSMKGIEYKYSTNNEDDLHKIMFKYNHRSSNDEQFENLLLASGIYISPFIGKGSFNVEGTIMIDKITSDISAIAYSVEYNRFDKSENDYNQAKIKVEIKNSKFNEIDGIFPPKN